MWLLKVVLGSPYRGEGWYTAPNFAWAKRIGWTTLNEILDYQPVKLKVGDGNATDLIIPLIGGKYIRLVGMDKYDILRSGGPIAVANDEKAYSDPRGFTEVIDPATADKQAPTLDVSTPKGRNHFYHDWLTGWSDGRAEQSMSWRIRTEDVGTVKLSELARYKKGGDKQMTSEFFAQEWEGEFLGYEGLVFPEFIGRGWPAGHLIPAAEFQRIKHRCWLFGSCDWGRSDDTVIHWLAKTPQNRLIVYDELCTKNRTPAQVVGLAKAKGLPAIVFLDPSAWGRESDGKSVAEKFQNAGMRCVRGDNRFDPSIQHIRQMMTVTRGDEQPYFLIVEGMAPKAIENLSLLEDRDIQPAGGGFKNHADCHAIDSLRYGAMTMYAGAKTDLRSEDLPQYGPLWRGGRGNQSEGKFHPVSGRPTDEGGW